MTHSTPPVSIAPAGQIGVWILLVVLLAISITLLSQRELEPIVVTPEPEEITYQVTITNSESGQPLSPGIFVTHDDTFSFNYEGVLSPISFEPLAEYGDTSLLLEDIVNNPIGVYDIVPIDTVIYPGETTTFTITAQPSTSVLLSGIQMVLTSNDGLIITDAVPLSGIPIVANPLVYDNGTEENAPLGSGFLGGQPDLNKGAANIENGTPTLPIAPVTQHPQLPESGVTITIEETFPDSTT